MATAKLAQIFKDLGIEYGRADLVSAHRPLAEVDLAAAIGTEREVLVLGPDQHSARRAAENFRGFFLGRHVLCAVNSAQFQWYKASFEISKRPAVWLVIYGEMKQILSRLAWTLPVAGVSAHSPRSRDPIQAILGEGAAPADIDALRRQYGLDQPLGVQYLRYWKGVAHGDLGNSIRMHDSVAHLIAQRYPYTLALTLAALVFGLALALPAGIAAAVRRGQIADQAISVVSLFGLSVPGLALGPVLILVFSIMLGWFPVSGANSGGGRGID